MMGALPTFFATLALQGVTLGSQPPSNCDLSPISHPISGTDTSRTISEVRASFTQKKIEFIVDGKQIFKEAIIPTITVVSDSSEIVKTINEVARGVKIPSALGKVTSSGVHKTYVSHGALVTEGSTHIEKWVSMTGWGCTRDGWKISCGSREWKTRLWEKTVGWTTSTRLVLVTVLPSRIPSSEPTSTGDSLAPYSDFALSTQGSIEDVSNEFSVYMAALTGAINGAITKNLLDEKVPDGFTNSESLRIKEKLNPDEASLLYRSTSSLSGAEGVRGQWQIFSDTIEANSYESKFAKSDGATPDLELSFTQNNREYAKRIKAHNPKYAFDLFRKDIFCKDNAAKAREEVAKYLSRIAEKLGGPSQAGTFSGSMLQLETASIDRFGNPDAARFLVRREYVSKLGPNRYTGRLPSMAELDSGPPFVRAWDSIDSLANYYGASPAETTCLLALAKARTGNASKIVPFDDVSSCLPVSDFASPVQAGIAEASLLEALRNNAVADTANPSFPLTNASYRGQYYCYRNTSICIGRDNVMWWQEPSFYGARGGRHKGIDIFGDNHSGESTLLSVASGILSYSAADLSDWGHVITLAFSKGGQQYVAVYAHLPSSVKALHGKRVKQGEAFATTGCSGNAGDGNGACNTYCRYSGNNRTDEHLHFEVLKKADGQWKKTDPLDTVVGTIAWDKQKVLHHCEGMSTLE